MVACPERDADEWKVALQSDRRDGEERAVATRHSQGFRPGFRRPAGDLGRVVVLGEDVDVDTKATSLPEELLR
jgi:hypothetical protein